MDQVTWYRNQSIATEQKYGKKIPSLMWGHIALHEHRNMWFASLDSSTEADHARALAKHSIIGERNEDECPGPFNSGLFNAFLERGDVLGYFVGHDHVNTYVRRRSRRPAQSWVLQLVMLPRLSSLSLIVFFFFFFFFSSFFFFPPPPPPFFLFFFLLPASAPSTGSGGGRSLARGRYTSKAACPAATSSTATGTSARTRGAAACAKGSNARPRSPAGRPRLCRTPRTPAHVGVDVVVAHEVPEHVPALQEGVEQAGVEGPGALVLVPLTHDAVLGQCPRMICVRP